MEGMNDLEVDGTPFSVLMDQAVKLKSSSGKVLRKRYDSYPRYVQESMFHDENMKSLRSLEFEERIQATEEINEVGKMLFVQSQFLEASIQYQNALRFSFFLLFFHLFFL